MYKFFHILPVITVVKNVNPLTADLVINQNNQQS